MYCLYGVILHRVSGRQSTLGRTSIILHDFLSSSADICTTTRSKQVRGMNCFPPILSYVQSNAVVSISAKSSEEPDGRPARLPSSLPYPSPTLKKERMLRNPFSKLLCPVCAIDHSLDFPSLKCIRQDPAPSANARLNISVTSTLSS